MITTDSMTVLAVSTNYLFASFMASCFTLPDGGTKVSWLLVLEMLQLSLLSFIERVMHGECYFDLSREIPSILIFI
jgi:hypothetical protein